MDLILLLYLYRKYNNVCGIISLSLSLSTLSNWDLEFDRWAPSVVRVIWKVHTHILNYKIIIVLLNRGLPLYVVVWPIKLSRLVSMCY